MIHLMNTTPAASPAPPAAQAPATPADLNSLANENTFLQLLVAQIRNQNPLSPTDGVQFLSQLAQFSNLEQTIQIRQDLDTIAKQLKPAAGGSTPAP